MQIMLVNHVYQGHDFKGLIRGPEFNRGTVLDAVKEELDLPCP